MQFYSAILVVKFLAVLTFGGGALATFLVADARARKRAVHQIASPALLVVWLSGLALVLLQGLRWSELWVLLGFAGSFAMQAVLSVATARGRTPPRAAAVAVAVLMALTVLVMVTRPTWSAPL